MSERGLFLNIDFTFDGDGWYEPITGQLERLVQDLPMWPQFKTVKPRGGKASKLDAASLAAAIRFPGGRAWELLAAKNDGQVALECRHFEELLLIRIEVYEHAWAEYAGQLVPIAWRFIEALRPGVVMAISGICPRFIPDLPWDEVPHRPIANFLRYENVVDFFDSRLVTRWTGLEGGPVVERILAAPAPSAARRIERDGVVMQSFTDALTDEKVLAAARMQHERWLAERVRPAGPERDRRMTVSRQVEAPPLSFIDPESRIGFKTVVVFPDGSREDDAWRAAETIAADGEIEPFGKLAGVYVIVPLREHALALYQEAQNSGLAGIAYPDDRGALWVVTAPH